MSKKLISRKNLPFFFNLLKQETKERFLKNPDELFEIVKALPDHITHVIIDEIQKVPALPDVVHDLIESTNKHFIMTGSSARKLKSAGVNLPAGRAFISHNALAKRGA